MGKRLPKFWHDSHGSIRLLHPYPIEGYFLARRPGAAAFAITATELIKQYKPGKGEK